MLVMPIYFISWRMSDWASDQMPCQLGLFSIETQAIFTYVQAIYLLKSLRIRRIIPSLALKFTKLYLSNSLKSCRLFMGSQICRVKAYKERESYRIVELKYENYVS